MDQDSPVCTVFAWTVFEQNKDRCDSAIAIADALFSVTQVLDRERPAYPPSLGLDNYGGW